MEWGWESRSRAGWLGAWAGGWGQKGDSMLWGDFRGVRVWVEKGTPVVWAVGYKATNAVTKSCQLKTPFFFIASKNTCQ